MTATKREGAHTAGPWSVCHESCDEEWSVVVASGGRVVANVNALTGPDVPPMAATVMPKDSNARLIAASPDLLEAAQAALNCIAELPATQARMECFRLLQSAIAKAGAGHE